MEESCGKFLKNLQKKWTNSQKPGKFRIIFLCKMSSETKIILTLFSHAVLSSNYGYIHDVDIIS